MRGIAAVSDSAAVFHPDQKICLQSLMSPVVPQVIVKNARQWAADFAQAVPANVSCVDLSGLAKARSPFARSKARGSAKLHAIAGAVCARKTGVKRYGTKAKLVFQ